MESAQESFGRRLSTFITNFNEKDEPQYKTAIHKFGSKEIWIEDKPIYPEMNKGYKSLHSTLPNLSAFWRIFDSICEEFPTVIQVWLNESN